MHYVWLVAVLLLQAGTNSDFSFKAGSRLLYYKFFAVCGRGSLKDVLMLT